MQQTLIVRQLTGCKFISSHLFNDNQSESKIEIDSTSLWEV